MTDNRRTANCASAILFMGIRSLDVALRVACLLAAASLHASLLNAQIGMSQEEQRIRSLSTPGTSAEEQTVRMMYSKLALLTQLHVVSSAAINSYVSSHGVIDDSQKNSSADLAQQLSDASVDFQLSDFRVGPMSEIMGQKWANQLTLSPNGQELLDVTLQGHNFSDGNQTRARWQTATAQWRAAPALNEKAAALRNTGTVKELLDLANSVTKSDIEYASYASYKVTAGFQNKIVSYKAIYLFGDDAAGHWKAHPYDPLIVIDGLGANDQSLFPEGLLRSNLSKVPILKQWLQDHAMYDATCSAAGTGDFCCVSSRCGIASSDLNK